MATVMMVYMEHESKIYCLEPITSGDCCALAGNSGCSDCALLEEREGKTIYPCAGAYVLRKAFCHIEATPEQPYLGWRLYHDGSKSSL